ncbi:MAG: sensor histidine kinase [Brumimicrobium sp.]
MINYLKVPKTKLTDFYDKARFALTWRIGIIFSIVIIVLTILTYLGDNRFFIYYASVSLLILASVLYMYYFRLYKLVSKAITIGASLVILFSVIFVNDALHIIEPLWMIVLVLYSYFTLGKIWGNSMLFLNAALYFIYFNFLFHETIELRVKASDLHIFLMSIEFAFSMFLIGYIMFQFTLVNSYAEKLKKRAFEELQAEKIIVEEQNEEKTVLLQEIHHRVKNNLQVIISLLRIQSSELKSAESRQSFNDAISRIMTMSLIHKKMYEKESLVDIDISDYLSTLIDDLIRTNLTTGEVKYQVDASLKQIGSKTIVPLALITNELVSNSLKHAFESDGFIKLSLSKYKDDFFEMKYSDNGKWKDESSEPSFGLQLIEVFTEQLEGTYQRTITESGTHYTFHLKTLDQ